MKRIPQVLLVLALAAAVCRAQTEMSVFNDNRCLIRQNRETEVKKGVQRLEFAEVSSHIIPASVSMKIKGEASKYSILEQNFEYDLVSRGKLLEKYIGKEITVERRLGLAGDKKESVRGTLLSVADGITVQADGRILLNPEGEISLPQLPEGLMLRPTLSWLIDSEFSGKKQIEVSYLAGGISWAADYVIVTSPDDKKMDLTGWVTVTNDSGASYKDARLKLIAGDVNKVQERGDFDGVYEERMVMKANAAAGFSEKAFSEYHLYTLGRRTDLKDKEIKQIEFANAAGAGIKKIYSYDAARVASFGGKALARNIGIDNQKKVEVFIDFRNSKENNLGFPLPKGTIRVYKADTDGALEFTGEDRIDHTPVNENIHIKLGNAFDITGERVQTDYKTGTDWCEESFRITLKNAKDVPVEVSVVEHLYRWSNWKILERSGEFAGKDARTIEFPVKVPAQGEQTLTYTVKYWW